MSFAGGARVIIVADDWHDDSARALAAIEDNIDRYLSSPDYNGRPIGVHIEEVKRQRTKDQNNMMHAVFRDVAEGMTKLVEGKTYTIEDAKDYLVQSKFGTEKKMVGKLEIVRRRSTKDMEVDEARDFIEWCLAWACDHKIPVNMPREYVEWAKL